MNKLLWIVVAVVVVAGGWYWWSMQATPAPATPAAQMGTNGSPDQGNMGGAGSGAPQQPSDGTSVSQNLALGLMSDAKLGQYLTAYNGMTVYTYSKDTAGKSTCTGTCAANWPPYTVAAGTTLNLQAGVTGAIATAARADGSMQVTYKGMPLYFYVKDAKPGDVNGQAVGGVWYVVKP